MNNDPMVRAFEEDATKAERVPLASRTFLALAQRQVRRKANPRKANQRIPDSQRYPDFSEGCACAQVLLASVLDRERWERDLHPDEISLRLAERWLTGGGLDELLSIMGGSEESTICWDAFGRICDTIGAGGVPGRKGEFARYRVQVPIPLFVWYFEAIQGLRSRPPEIAPSPHRTTKLGYVIRDIRIQGAIRVLAQVGMPPTGGPDSGCSVVAEVLGYKDPRTVRAIWRKPATTINEYYEKHLYLRLR